MRPTLIVLKVILFLLAAIGLIFTATVALGVITQFAYADQEPVVNIYDSPSDKTKVVIEVCVESCHKLITDKATLAQDYPKIQKWMTEALPKLEN